MASSLLVCCSPGAAAHGLLCEYPSVIEDVVCVEGTDRRDPKSWCSIFPSRTTQTTSSVPPS
jgi:hypothetical protein